MKEKNISTCKELLFAIIFSVLYVVYIWVLHTYVISISIDNSIFVLIGNFALASLATYRLNRFVASDAITQPVRDLLLQSNIGILMYTHRLLTCPWCATIWIVPAVLTIGFLSNLTFFFVVVLAISAIASFLSLTSKFIASKM